MHSSPSPTGAGGALVSGSVVSTTATHRPDEPAVADSSARTHSRPSSQKVACCGGRLPLHSSPSPAGPAAVGLALGLVVGFMFSLFGAAVGLAVGLAVLNAVGVLVGLAVGLAVGSVVGLSPTGAGGALVSGTEVVTD